MEDSRRCCDKCEFGKCALSMCSEYWKRDCRDYGGSKEFDSLCDVVAYVFEDLTDYIVIQKIRHVREGVRDYVNYRIYEKSGFYYFFKFVFHSGKSFVCII